MAFVPCEWFYEYMLGDNCDNKCNECFGDKDVRICKEDFEVVGEMLAVITIEKGSWWSVVFMNYDHVLLDGLDGHQLRLKRDLFERYFENFVYDDSEGEE
jgi:hypothetical protein